MPNGNTRLMSDEARDNIGVLTQRVATVEAGQQKIEGQLNSLNDKFDSQSRVSSEKIDTLFRGLDQRLSAQFESIGREYNKQISAVDEKTSERINSLSDLISTMRQPNYQVWLGLAVLAITLFGTTYGFVSQPINESLSRLETAITTQGAAFRADLSAIRDQMVPRTELDERWRVIERDIDRNSQRTETALQRPEFEEYKRSVEATRQQSRADAATAATIMGNRVAEIEASIVSRGEHERQWQANDQRIADLQRQIDEAKDALGSTYSLRDFIFRLNERLDRIEGRVMTPP